MLPFALFLFGGYLIGSSMKPLKFEGGGELEDDEEEYDYDGDYKKLFKEKLEEEEIKFEIIDNLNKSQWVERYKKYDKIYKTYESNQDIRVMVLNLKDDWVIEIIVIIYHGEGYRKIVNIYNNKYDIDETYENFNIWKITTHHKLDMDILNTKGQNELEDAFYYLLYE